MFPAKTFGAFVERRNHYTPPTKFRAWTSEVIPLYSRVSALQQEIQGDIYLAYPTCHQGDHSREAIQVAYK